MSRVVAALGGNALLRRTEPPTIERQRANVRTAVTALVPLAADHQLIITHGNGPQVGLLALQAEDGAGAEAYPLDVLDAETEGQIGYLIEQELRNRLPGREVVTVLTQVLVHESDAAFGAPSKPIGPVYPAEAADQLARVRGWVMRPDTHGFRRVVPSPEPVEILPLGAIELLAGAGAIVVCAGGGGIPVARSAEGDLHGVEAVIDKDLVSALLAVTLRADQLLLLTDVEAVVAGWGTAAAAAIATASPAELRSHRFAPGSMGPKVEAACRFVDATGRPAGIGRLEDAAKILAGVRGTLVKCQPSD